MRIWYMVFVVVFLSFTTIYEINEKEVSRILNHLASDDMAGRKIGSDGIKKASLFIENEFKTIGLSKLGDLKSYEQPFVIHSVSVTNTHVKIDTHDLPETSYFIMLGSNEVHWNAKDTPKVMQIPADANFRALVSKAMQAQENYLVLIHPKHSAIFNQYRQYFSREQLELPDSKNVKASSKVFVLSELSEVNEFEIAAKKSSEELSLNNVVGVIPGKRSKEIVLFSAHYDHLGMGDNPSDNIYNGANDDASGVTAVIELARYFKSRGTPERTLVFAAFTAEEVGGYGSKYFSQQLNPDDIVAMFNIEMIGKVSKKGLNSAWMTGWDKSNLGTILQENLAQMNYEFFADPYPDQHLFYRSDNATLARLGVPAHSISTTQIDIDKDYHQVTDEVASLDITNITNTIKAIAVGTQGIVDGLQTPSRVNPANVD